MVEQRVSVEPPDASGDSGDEPDGGFDGESTVGSDSGFSVRSGGDSSDRSGDGSHDGSDDGSRYEATVVGEPIGAGVDEASHLVVVGYDAWTGPVLTELADRDVSVTVITADHAGADRLAEHDVTVVDTDDVDEACFREAEIGRADAVLVATLDDQLNVLAVLTVMNVDSSMRVLTFAGEAQDVPKLRTAGADRVVSLGEAVGELLVEVALSERAVSAVVEELVGDRS